MVVRAVTKNSQGYGKVINKSYFITTGQLAQYKEYTVVSLVTNPENLFDPDKGIYVNGTQYINWKKSDSYNPAKSVWDPNNICNYFSRGSEWEREAHISIFENGKITVEENVGIRIKGSSSRNLQQKNFNVYARKKYGNDKIKKLDKMEQKKKEQELDEIEKRLNQIKNDDCHSNDVHAKTEIFKNDKMNFK